MGADQLTDYWVHVELGYIFDHEPTVDELWRCDRTISTDDIVHMRKVAPGSVVYAVESGEEYRDDYLVHEMFEAREDAEAWIVETDRLNQWVGDYRVVERDVRPAGIMASARPVALFEARWASARHSEPYVDPWTTASWPWESKVARVEEWTSYGVPGVLVYGYGATQAEALADCRRTAYRFAADMKEIS